MKKGGYQVLNLECKSYLRVIDYFINATENTWVDILNIDNNKVGNYLENLFKYNKACLLKNVYVNSEYSDYKSYFNYFTSIIKTTNNVKSSIYVVDSQDSSQGIKYKQLTTDDIIAFKINDDYALVISKTGLLSGNVINENVKGKAIILKLYKGAITQ